ncbi:MAG: replication-associated recombination protein A [Synergistaceae bacterium]|jgi:putative ATPase|nr:replication-associated recombination protein A [Synergistaceae bacterium]PKL03761.1 MAG: AAA family ATPase [Synergistetes bacterium HGW-Synergistetes-1]MBP9559349.1 replication-associated recombination protein A [Synergistaceae bacterium]MBP9975941.1 replication-associated recombination protein A [Synergistaceae bacterium]MCE5184432.1 replication-associated recombination protein A [Synergistaceae bacterium]
MEEGSLFGPEKDHKIPIYEIPLAERMRPDNLDDYAGQEHILGPGKPLRIMLEGGKVPSCILYGPPGVGKTTLVRIMSKTTGRELLEINAVSAKVETLRTLVDQAKASKRTSGRSAIAFVDEIYHFNTKQQNVLLPSVETGDIILVGTTTENPWFEINKTLLSRMVVYTLKPLDEENIASLLENALSDKVRGLGMLEVTADKSVIGKLALLAGGDARQALTRLEAAASAVALGGGREVTLKIIAESTGMATQRYDRVSDDHYAVISALIKSLRGSDPDAALYWLARMLAAGDDLRFICRRLCIFASEDVGLADSMALVVAQNAAAAVDRVGLPEADIILGQAVVYLASAPKSNSSYLGIRAAMKAVEEGDLMEVPYHLRNDGEGYQYPHDSPGHWVPQAYLPEQRRFYYPGKLGAEARIKERLKLFWKRFADDTADEQGS